MSEPETQTIRSLPDLHSDLAGAGHFPEMFDKEALKRAGQPQEVAEVAAFLASDRASFVAVQSSRLTAAGPPNW